MKRIIDKPSMLILNVFQGLPKWKKITIIALGLVFCTLSAALFFTLNLSKSEVYERYYESMKPGYLASESVFSDSAYYLEDTEESQKAYQKMKREVLPVFSNDINVCFDSYGRANLLANALKGDRDSFIREAENSGLPYELAAVAYEMFSSKADVYGALLINFTEQILEIGLVDSSDLAKYAAGFSTVTVQLGFEDDSDDYVAKAKEDCFTSESIADYVGQSELLSSDEQKQIFAKVVSSITGSNLRYNELLSLKQQSLVNPEDSKVFYSLVPNQIIIEQNTIITEESSRILLLLSQTNSRVPTSRIVGSILLMLLVTTICIFLFDWEASDSLHKFEFFLVFLIGGILSVVLAFFGYKFAQRLNLVMFEVLMPIFAVPLLISLLSGNRNLGMICSILISSAICMIPNSDFTTFFLCLISSGSCVFLVRFLSRRRDLLIQWLLTLSLSIFFLLISFIFERNGFFGFFKTLEYGVFNIIMAFVIVSIALPIIEDMLNIPTLFKLRELANEKSPILQRLSQEAPGTYSHSMAVADIAENAARVVGANAALVRVGAMYHDIGKIDHAEYFTENISLLKNIPEEKSHENINRNLSVAIIKSHVKLGVEKGKQVGLPQEVLDIIGNHHGNDVVVYFYNLAMKDFQENPQQYPEPKIEEYTYLGDPPQTPEQAIVMLSDCSEAACRSIVKPTPNKIEKMVTMILIKKIVNKQLISCSMTITDLNKVVKSLSESLTGRSHSRISYPEEEKK